MSTPELIPLYYDGQDRSAAPVCFDTRENIKKLRRAGELDGWYQQNGRIFVIYVPAPKEIDYEKIVAGSGFDQAWAIRSSGGHGSLGECGLLVWQMNTVRAPLEANS